MSKSLTYLDHDQRSITARELAQDRHARPLSLGDALPFLMSPDSGKPLRVMGEGLTDGEIFYPLRNGSPVLYPKAAAQLMVQAGIPPRLSEEPLLQYLALSRFRQAGEINAPQSNIHAQRHFWRMREFLSNLSGTALDVGCDDVSLSASLYPPDCTFLGLDPFGESDGFRVVGIGEVLPFRSGSVDNVVFNTSLDHILDYFEALSEARRVLRPGGALVICTLIWADKGTLLTDSVHFHHFREYEIMGALNSLGLTVSARRAYAYKDDGHRFGLYLCAR